MDAVAAAAFPRHPDQVGLGLHEICATPLSLTAAASALLGQV